MCEDVKERILEHMAVSFLKGPSSVGGRVRVAVFFGQSIGCFFHIFFILPDFRKGHAGHLQVSHELNLNLPTIPTIRFIVHVALR